MATSFRWSRRARNPCACSSLRVDTHREYHLHRHRCINNAVVKMRRRGRPCAPSHSTLAVGKVAATIQPVDAGFLSQAMACTAVPLPHLQAGQSGTMFLPPCVCVHMCPVRAAQNPEQLAGSLCLLYALPSSFHILTQRDLCCAKSALQHILRLL